MGHARPPLLDIPWENIVVDLLHLWLRIGGKLFNQVKYDMF